MPGSGYFTSHQYIDYANRALRENDMTLMVTLVEAIQANIGPHTNNITSHRLYPVAQHVCKCARMLILIRYGKMRAQRLAGAYKTRRRGGQV